MRTTMEGTRYFTTELPVWLKVRALIGFGLKHYRKWCMHFCIEEGQSGVVAALPSSEGDRISSMVMHSQRASTST